MSTKSTKISACCGNCLRAVSCYDISGVVFNGKGRKFPRCKCPFEFFEWLKKRGDVVRISHCISDFYEHYNFYVGSMEVMTTLPHWITDAMLVDYFGCSVVLLYGGCYNG